MEIMKTIKDGKSSLIEILEDSQHSKKFIKDTVQQLTKAGYIVECYTDRRNGESFEVTKKGEKSLKRYLEVEHVLLTHAPEILEKK
jgi:predicted transcriptional regulator